ncbi:TetR/AcrR family transcriptional regulator [Nonomuraea sp. SYSU D8015]|uniref:TetR/AcrR family transcriptional regulator n=1 Tax=Nonomuraea sp. SYSU D8015 TaxID=2593644 RepID=UPI001CB6BB47|nr:TetR/AcrR family transcriptional regulator [Nonomuraea sp. SYSU D8015]
MDRHVDTAGPRPGAFDSDATEGRTARKRRAILEAATEVFLRHGYLGASMDEVAARAAVSKQTVYKQFQDKEHLFAEIILGTNTRGVDGLMRAYATILDEATDAQKAMRALAQQYLDSFTEPEFLQLRRLVLAEADRFPDISGAWFKGAFHRSLVLLGEALARMADRGLLRDLPDPTLAAYHFAGLVMYKPLNQAMFAGTAARPEAEELSYLADRAAEAFLAIYGPS